MTIFGQYMKKLPNPAPAKDTNSTSEQKARLMGLERGFILVQRGPNRLYQVYKGGFSKHLCTSHDIGALWDAAIEMIKHQDSKKKPAPRWMRFTFNVIHNTFIHPIMPFTFGKVGRLVDVLHDFTGTVAFTLPPEQTDNGVTND